MLLGRLEQVVAMRERRSPLIMVFWAAVAAADAAWLLVLR
jgi:hypothetical protein